MTNPILFLVAIAVFIFYKNKYQKRAKQEIEKFNDSKKIKRNS
jgi:preprotein translocase subunit YajC